MMENNVVTVDLSELEAIEASTLQAVIQPGGVCGLACGVGCGLACGVGCWEV